MTALILLNVNGSVPMALAASIVLGLSTGGEMNVVTFVAAQRFGRQIFGSIYALFTAILALATSLGPLVAGMFFDHFGSYDSYLIAVFPVVTVAALVMATVPMGTGEAEPEAANVMLRPPRSPSESPFAGNNVFHAVLQGSGFAAVLLLGYGLLLTRSADPAQARTAVFFALVAGVFLLTLANRDPSRFLLAGMTAGNPWILRMFVGVLAMLVAMIGIPLFRTLMGLAMPDMATLAAAVSMLGISVAWLEGSRLTMRFLATR